MFFDPKRALDGIRKRTVVAGRAGRFEGELFRLPLFATPAFACDARYTFDTRCARYDCVLSWFFALTSSFPVFPVSFRRRAKYTAGVSRSDVKIKIT